MIKLSRFTVILLLTVFVFVSLLYSGAKTVRAASLDTLTGLRQELPIPEAKRCADMNFETTGSVRVGINADRVDQINCRVIVQNENYFSFNGEPLTTPAQIGSQWLLDQGVVQAIEIFSPSGLTTFQNGDVFCLQGTGQLYFLSAATTPREILQAPVYRAPDFVGFVCTTLFGPGTLVMTQKPAPLPPPPPTTIVLTDCTVTVTYSVRMRVEPNTQTSLLAIIPFTTVLSATGKVSGWYRVTYEDKTGWIRSRYETSKGTC